MSKHTPGDWVIQCNHQDQMRVAIDGGNVICRMARRSKENFEEVANNSCLIAAAPDMLEELREALVILERHRIDPQRQTRILAVISEAEGEPV